MFLKFNSTEIRESHSSRATGMLLLDLRPYGLNIDDCGTIAVEVMKSLHAIKLFIM